MTIEELERRVTALERGVRCLQYHDGASQRIFDGYDVACVGTWNVTLGPTQCAFEVAAWSDDHTVTTSDGDSFTPQEARDLAVAYLAAATAAEGAR